MYCIPIFLSGAGCVTFYYRRLSLVAENSLTREAKLCGAHTPQLSAPGDQSECRVPGIQESISPRSLFLEYRLELGRC